MKHLDEIIGFLNDFAPLESAEEWDNVGLLLGDPGQEIERIMTCLTVTPVSAAEAIERGAQLIVSHHPLPFRPLKQITTGSTAGGMLWNLARAGVGIYSPHTAFDSAAAGINQRLAEGLGLEQIAPLRPPVEAGQLGSGRYGRLPASLSLREVAEQLKAFLSIEHCHAIGSLDQPITHLGVACGSAGEFLADADRVGCQLLITGETSFHTCLDAEARKVCLLLTGHYASERFAVERLAEVLTEEYGDLEIWASQQESDPVKWI